MKKIIALILAVVMVFALAVSTAALISPTPDDYNDIKVVVDGNGKAEADKYKVKKGSGDDVTLTATETSDSFVNWTIDGEYIIVSGNLSSKVLVIEPQSDIVATAHFKGTGGGSGNNDNTSPKTSDPIVYVLAVMLIAAAGGIFCVRKIRG